jgi:N6-L-threonylcarbamoyladenine synthase
MDFVTTGLILGIESSCDETAAAVVRAGEEVLSSIVASQLDAHQLYGGVVPELAAREHLRAITPVVRKALTDACVTIADVDAIAVTQGPGLAGALLVGISYAKAMAFAAERPVIAVNHLEGHIHAVVLEQKQRGGGEMEFPVLALVVSGGHTHLYLAEKRGQSWTYENIGRTRDDAAGEAFDKVAKLLGLGYPGGPLIDQLAPFGDPAAVKFPPAQLKHVQRQPSKKQPPRPANGAREHTYDFSYSGIKTAVLRYTETHNMKPALEARHAQLSNLTKPTLDDYQRACDQPTLDLIASFQRGMVDDIVGKTMRAARECEVSTLLVTGGVAANSELRTTFEREAAHEGIAVHFPSRKLSTDNAAMIAAAAWPKFLTGDFAEAEFSAEAALALH